MSYQSYLESIAAHSQKPASPASPIARKPAASINLTSTPPSNSNPNAGTITPSSTSIAQSVTSTAPSAAPIQTSQPVVHHLTPITQGQIDAALATCLKLQVTATTEHGKRPFAGLLLGPDNTTILLTHFSINHIKHAETQLARLAAENLSRAYLASCTLVSTWEPCAMCAGTLYWSNIGRLIYAASETKLKELTGPNNNENMTMSLPCREVFKHGQRDIEVIGPVPEWEKRVVEESGKWWKKHQEKQDAPSIKENGSSRHVASPSVATTWVGEENGTVGDDGEYKADLQIDWMR